MAKASSSGPFVGCFPQLLLSPVTSIDAAVVHDDHHNWQLIPAHAQQSFRDGLCQLIAVLLL